MSAKNSDNPVTILENRITHFYLHTSDDGHRTSKPKKDYYKVGQDFEVGIIEQNSGRHRPKADNQSKSGAPKHKEIRCEHLTYTFGWVEVGCDSRDDMTVRYW